MKTIISASRRTDIPAFYMDWLVRAVRAGRVRVRNPVYRRNFIDVNLRPDQVEWFVFWSRNYRQFLKQREIFADYNLFFHFTILSPHRQLERSQLPAAQALNQVEKLASYYDPQRIIWRYDPIVIWQEPAGIASNYNSAQYDFLCHQLSQLGIHSCYISLVSPYSKFLRRFKQKFPHWRLLAAGSAAEQHILPALKETAAKYSMNLFSCCNDGLIDSYIQKGHCISGERLNKLAGRAMVSCAKAPTRKDCGCTKSVDIGDYERQPCYFGCIYCYANPVILKAQKHKGTKGQRDKGTKVEDLRSTGTNKI
jgi:hypothetical protein